MPELTTGTAPQDDRNVSKSSADRNPVHA